MGYRVEFMPEAADAFYRLNKVVAQRVVSKLKWLSQNFDNLTPEVLTGELRGLYKLRIGSYRVIYSADRDAHLLTVHLLGHRRDIYKR
jgi:mRNA interferase RelE/StbE